MTEEQKHQIKDMLIQYAEENKETTYMAFKSRALCDRVYPEQPYFTEYKRSSACTECGRYSTL